MSIAAINTRGDAAAALIEAGDYAGAYPLLLSAKTLLAIMPDTSKKGAAELHWDRASIDSLIAMVERQIGLAASSAGGLNPRGVVRQNIRYRRVRGDDCD